MHRTGTRRAAVAVIARGRAAAVALAAAAVGACGEPAAQVALVPLGPCAQAMGANLVRITAFAGHGERSKSLGLDQTISIADFPADTEQLGVEVIVGGGAVGAAGKSAPIAFNDLADGATIPVVMAPLDGFCEVGPMHDARAQPLVVRAGDGALVVGGDDASGPVRTVEYYDPLTLSFTPVELPEGLDDPQGFAGIAAAPLPDGRVALVGGAPSSLLVFDPAQRAFTVGPLRIAARALHAAIATGADEVIVAGGCFGVANHQCSGVPLHQVQRYHVSKTGPPDTVGLPPTNGQRVNAQLFDLGVQLDGQRRYLLAGGSDDPGADRFALTSDPAIALPGGHAQPVALDGGAVLTAFAADARTPDGRAAVYAPDGAAAQPIMPAPDLAGVRLIGLEDGRVVGFGGDPDGGVLTYDPTRDLWATARPMTRPGALNAPALARLADGTILVLGGAVSPRAWLYRPSLVGPASGTVTAAPTSDAARGVLTPSDPATVTRTGDQLPAWILASPGDALTARALVGGTRPSTGSLRATVHVLAGGVALIAEQTAPGQALVAELAPDAPPSLVQLADGAARTICSGAALAAFDPAVAVALRLTIGDGTAQLAVDDREVLSCALAATTRGAWGVAALGTGARVAVDSVIVAR